MNERDDSLFDLWYIQNLKVGIMKNQRNIVRIIHLIGAAAIGTFIYSPYGGSQWLQLLVQVGVIPLLTLTGLWLWKPKWFRVNRKAIPISISLLALLSLTGSSHAQDKLKGGSGGFMVGYKAYNTSAYQFFVAESGPTLGDGLIQIGGEGYGLINRWVIGGGGYYNRGDKVEDSNLEYQLHGGGGYLNVGYVVYTTDQMLVFPLLGVGADALGINRGIDEDVAFEPGRFLEANYFTITPILDLGAGVDWFPYKKGLKLGIRAGYNISLSRDNDWRHYGGDVTDPGLPSNDLDGFYVRLTVGGGYFMAKE